MRKNTDGPVKTMGTATNPTDATSNMFANSNRDYSFEASLGRIKENRTRGYDSIRSDKVTPPPPTRPDPKKSSFNY